MGVPPELLGRQVRCPHCKQVVVAPTAADLPTAPSRPVVTPPPAQPSAPPREPELRPFHLPARREGADSILSEPGESDDEVFGSHPGNKLPTLPRAEVPPAPPPEPPQRPQASDPADSAGTLEYHNPFDPPRPAPVLPIPVQRLAPPAPTPAPASSGDSQASPFAFTAPSQPPRPTTPPTPAPAEVGSSNPFVSLDPPVRRPEPEDEDDRSPQPLPLAEKKPRTPELARPEPAHPEPARAGGSTLALVGLAVYALVATGVAVYALFFRTTEPPLPAGEHPLSTIPDNFGEFDPVSRKKVSKLNVPANAPLPDAQRAGIGDRLAVGQIEVQPLKVEKRRLYIDTESADGREKPVTIPTDPALVLTLAIKNTSPDLPIFPMDPAFTRAATPTDQPLTGLVVGPKTFAGGKIEWPLDRSRYKKRIERQQANDSVPLRPGELRHYVVFTADSSELVRVATAARTPLQWRVQVRRGLVEYKGKEVPVTAVIGVDFTAADIREP
ncbi:MAG: hypothetical protein K2V38_09300 [Gemmataceae bacterium]|nr:hypothetical protein [Gemmataceae bacterium]